MTDINDENQEDKPLDPVMEGVRRKMVKLQLISGGIMAVLFLAVLVSIFYKLTRDEGGAEPVAATSSSTFAVPSDQPLSLTANLPAGFRVVQTSLSGSQSTSSSPSLPDTLRRRRQRRPSSDASRV